MSFQVAGRVIHGKTIGIIVFSAILIFGLGLAFGSGIHPKDAQGRQISFKTPIGNVDVSAKELVQAGNQVQRMVESGQARETVSRAITGVASQAFANPEQFRGAKKRMWQAYLDFHDGDIEAAKKDWARARKNPWL